MDAKGDRYDEEPKECASDFVRDLQDLQASLDTKTVSLEACPELLPSFRQREVRL